MTKPKSTPGTEPRSCDVCGRALRYGNTSGVCSGAGATNACKRERKNRDRIAACLLPYNPRTGPVSVRAGETYNSWEVLEDGSGVVNKVLCRCRCGIERPVLIAALTEGRSKSCGRRCEARRAANPYLLAGTYGRLEVLETALRSKDLVRTRCECGTESVKRAELIKNGHTASCGCKMGRWTHGLSRHPLYSTWNGIVDRCTNPRATGYERYGALGITVCDRWLDPAVFFEDILRDIGPRPEKRSPDGKLVFTIDRIEPEGNYEPGNVRWANKKTQSENRRTVAPLTSQRNAALAEVARLNALLTSRKRRPDVTDPGQGKLF